MSQNWSALIISFLYVFTMIGLAEVLGKWQKYSVDFTRKFIHIAVGMWIYGTVLLFETPTFAIIPPLSFVVINAISYWKGTFKAMESGERGQLGTIYFPISFALIVVFLWKQPHLAAASLMPMTWGDSMAAVVGSRYGKKRYTFWGCTRSMEGSITMLVMSFVATLIPLLLLAPVFIGIPKALGMAGATAVVTTLVEAVSPKGADNIGVPVASVGVLLLFHYLWI